MTTTSETHLLIQNFISGKFQQTISGKYIDSEDPSTGSIWARIPDSDSRDVDQAVLAAQTAFKQWSNSEPSYRSRILNKIADLIDSNTEELAKLESKDQGKPLWLARQVDIPRAAHNFRFFASAVLHHLDISHFHLEAQNFTVRSPVGVCALISPWNLPLYLLTFKLGPCLAAGNTAVCKPSEFTSVSAWKLCSLMNQAGLPAGVVNMVFGRGPSAGEAMVVHPSVPLISFTGSTVVGAKIQQLSAPFVKKLSLELGGKNAAIVFGDADLTTAAVTCARSSFINQGEVCLCTSRIFVHKTVFDEFMVLLVEQARQWKVGLPSDPDTKVGAVISGQHKDKIKGYLELAGQEGCTIHCGEGVDNLQGHLAKSSGHYVLPTVISNVSDHSKLMQEEIFGPVTCVVPFESEEEVIGRVNDVPYGLCASVYTRDSACAIKVCKKLNVGTTWVNCWLVRDLNMPFGGCKMSGIGREGFHDSLDFYSEVKTICIKL